MVRARAAAISYTTDPLQCITRPITRRLAAWAHIYTHMCRHAGTYKLITYTMFVVVGTRGICKGTSQVYNVDHISRVD